MIKNTDPYSLTKHDLMRFTVAVLFTLLALCFKAQDQDPFLTDFLSKWQNSKAYTLECAEAMPSESYDFSPVPDTRAFHEQLTHLCGNMIWLTTTYLGGEGLRSVETNEPPTDKEGIIQLLNESFNYATTTFESFDMDSIDEDIEFFAGTMSRRKVFFLIADHLTHHRGQIIVYLRLNNIKPPGYRGW